MSFAPRKSIFNAEEKALIQPFQRAYLDAGTSAVRKEIAIAHILPSIISKWESALQPGESLDTEQASKVTYFTIMQIVSATNHN